MSIETKANPNARLILYRLIRNYPEFGFAHPEEDLTLNDKGALQVRPGARPADDVIRNEQGESMIIVGAHFERFDTAAPQPQPGAPDEYAISFFSERYRTEVTTMLAELVRTVEASPYADRVAGFHFICVQKPSPEIHHRTHGGRITGMTALPLVLGVGYLQGHERAC